MTIKKSPLQSNKDTSYEDDDYYAAERKRIAEEAQKAHRIHEEDIQTHLTAMIPYYDDAEDDERRLLLTLNNLLIHRFSEVGMVYWGIFRHTPREILEYTDLFGTDLSQSDVSNIIQFMERKKEESENMIDIGFDEDGEEDDFGGMVDEDRDIPEPENQEEE